MKAKLFYMLAAFALIFAGCGEETPPAPTPDKKVTVAAQAGTLTAGEAGTATFAVTTTGIADGIAGAVAWFTDAAGNSAGTTPAGIQVSEFETAANKATVTMAAAEQIAEGTYFFKVTIDGTESAVATLKVNAAGTPALGLPTNLRVASKTQTGAVLEWDAVENADSYIVRLDGDATYPASALTHTLNNLTPGTAYTWEVASVRGDEQSAWVAGEGFTTEEEGLPALGLPVNPRVSGKTTTTASLKWDAADNADSYIVRLDGDATYPAAALTYTLDNLTPGTAYTWEVASVRGDEQSAWVAGEGFTTETELPSKELYLYGADFYIESSLGHLLLYLLDYDPDGSNPNGMQIRLRIKCDINDMDLDPAKKYVDLPAGTYNVADTDNTPYTIQVHNGTGLVSCIDGSLDYDNIQYITGGSMIVSGNDTDGYSMKLDFTHSGGTYAIQGQCPALEISNPDFGKVGRISNGNLGALTYTTVAYYAKPYEQNIDIFLVRGLGSAGITFDYNDYRYPKGTGYYVRAVELSTALNSNYIADGVYTIKLSCQNPGDVLNGYDNVNGGRSGFYVEQYENDVVVAASPLVSGTVTVTSLAVGYRLELNAKDDKGTDFTATITAN